VILPERNKLDLEEVPKPAIEGLTFHFVKEMGDVLKLALRSAEESEKLKVAELQLDPVAVN
jgi:ATP-dependent Lon protease